MKRRAFRIETAIRRVMFTAALIVCISSMAATGATLIALAKAKPGQQSSAHLKSEVARWTKVVKAAGIKVE